MSETAVHKPDERDETLAVVESLASLDLSKLSFVQLKRLQKTLSGFSEDVAEEAASRAEGDDPGDTVRIS